MKKIFCSLFFVMFFFALSTTSLAIPDVTAYNNFYSGVSVFTDNYNSIDDYHSGYFPFAPGDISVDTFMVNCFNNEFMSGSTPSTYVNGLNLDYTTGKAVVVPSGNCIVVYSKSGQIPLLYIQGQCDYMQLGTTNLVSDVVSVYGKKDNFSDNVAYRGFTSSGTGTTFGDFSDSITELYLPFKRITDSTLDLSTFNAKNSYNYSMVYYIYNSSSSNLYLSTGSYVDLSEIPVYDFETTSFSEVSYVFSYDDYSKNSAIQPDGVGISFYFPCINDNLDIYTYSYANRGVKVKSTYYNLGYSSNVLLKNPTYYTNSKSFTGYKFDFDKTNIQCAYGSCRLPVDNTYLDYAPIFLNDLHGQYKYAVRVNGGYVDISNYDLLIQKLKDAGFGSGGSSGDLSTIISLLDEMNTGGVTGENAKALIDSLEQSHQPIVDNGNTGWNSTKQMFEAYKQLFDFSGSSLHWLVVANNALFNIFSGIIMMCCVFIVFSRVFKS